MKHVKLFENFNKNLDHNFEVGLEYRKSFIDKFCE